jgi:hypothetical protein
MTALKQLAFSLAFAIAAVAAAQYIMWTLNGQPRTPPEGARRREGAAAGRTRQVVGAFDSR